MKSNLVDVALAGAVFCLFLLPAAAAPERARAQAFKTEQCEGPIYGDTDLIAFCLGFHYGQASCPRSFAGSQARACQFGAEARVGRLRSVPFSAQLQQAIRPAPPTPPRRPAHAAAPPPPARVAPAPVRPVPERQAAAPVPLERAAAPSAPAPPAPERKATAPVPLQRVEASPPPAPPPSPAPERPAPPEARRAWAGPPIDPDSLLGHGERLYREGDYPRALQLFLAAAKADPDDPRVYAFLAETYGRLSLTVQSRLAEETARRLDPAAMDLVR